MLRTLISAEDKILPLAKVGLFDVELNFLAEGDELVFLAEDAELDFFAEEVELDSAASFPNNFVSLLSFLLLVTFFTSLVLLSCLAD